MKIAADLMSKFNLLLYPISILYGIGVGCRNKLFDWGIWKEESFDIPIICVGNLTVGGTGKTPHVEYLIRLLKDKYKVAVVSRGYKRKSKGFVLATENHTYEDIGDEPFQIKRKFPQVLVAVDASRCEAIRNLLQLPSETRPQVILLDDAFQHRHVKPSYSILLTDYHRLYCKDRLLPAGRLRESKHGAERADAVIVTKTPEVVMPIGYWIVESDLRLRANQSLFFTKIVYGELQPLFPKLSKQLPLLKDSVIMAVSGIASPALFWDELKKRAKQVISYPFADHHDFNKQDLLEVATAFVSLQEKNKLLVVTEKDAVRLISNPNLGEALKPYIYYLPIQIGFQQGQDKQFDNKILNHINLFYQNNK